MAYVPSPHHNNSPVQIWGLFHFCSITPFAIHTSQVWVLWKKICHRPRLGETTGNFHLRTALHSIYCKWSRPWYISGTISLRTFRRLWMIIALLNASPNHFLFFSKLTVATPSVVYLLIMLPQVQNYFIDHKMNLIIQTRIWKLHKMQVQR